MNIKNITDVTSLENSYKGEIFVYVKNNSFDSVKDFIDANNLIAFIENENAIYAQGHKYSGLTDSQAARISADIMKSKQRNASSGRGTITSGFTSSVGSLLQKGTKRIGG